MKDHSQKDTNQDITRIREELLKAQEHARKVEAELAAALSHCMAWELWFDSDDKLRFSSSACKDVTGLDPSDFSEGLERFEELILAGDTALWRDFLSRMEELGSEAECTVRVTTPEEGIKWLKICGLHLSNEGKDLGLRLSIVDVSDQHHLQEDLSRLHFQDPLTGLPNRPSFLDRLEGILDLSRKGGPDHFAVIYLDIDRLRKINESLGHAYGDMLIVQVAERLGIFARGDRFLARISGDEFALLLPDVESEATVVQFAKTLRDTLSQPFSLNSHEISISTSMGIVLSPAAYDKPEDMLRNASITMRHAKSGGRNRFKVFNSRLLEESSRLTEMELDFSRGLVNGEFFIEYQPIISLQDYSITGFEALVRWRHEHRGVVPPTDFIPLAEETEFILPLGRWVLWEACSSMAKWREQYAKARDYTISINVSAMQIAQPDFVDQIREVLEHSSLPPESLKLEITESVIMKNPELVSKRLSLLREEGVKLSIDDFGTGYSSLAYLQHFPVDTLKVDQSFIRDMDSSPQKHEIVQAVIKLAHTFNMDVVAEGVEACAQREMLNSLACENAQGFFFSKPVDAQSISQMLDPKDMDNAFRKSRDMDPDT